MNPDLMMLFDGHPEELALYEAIEAAILDRFAGVRIKVAKTQISFKTNAGFAYVSLPRMKERPAHSVILTLALEHEIKSPRILMAVEPYPRRWTHHLIIESPNQLDEELMGWLADAYAFSQIRRGRG